MNRRLLDVGGAAAPPRRNGELVFEAPWQSRVFGLCAAIVETYFHGDREPFRQRLIAAIGADPERPYWDSWTIALEQLALDEGLLDEPAVDRRIKLAADMARHPAGGDMAGRGTGELRPYAPRR